MAATGDAVNAPNIIMSSFTEGVGRAISWAVMMPLSRRRRRRRRLLG